MIMKPGPAGLSIGDMLLYALAWIMQIKIIILYWNNVILIIFLSFKLGWFWYSNLIIGSDYQLNHVCIIY